MMIAKLILAVGTLCWSCALLAQGAPKEPVTIPAGSATITDVKGEVSVVVAQGTPAAAYKTEVVGPNTTIETRKGSVLLVLSDGSQVLVNANSRIILRLPEDSKGNFLEQLIGKVIAKVKKRIGNEPSFQMGTPSAVITVRGTRFLVEVTKKQRTLVEVYEGLVEVKGFGIGRPVLLQPGFTTQVGLNSTPESPRNASGEFEPGDTESRFPGRTSERDSEGRTTRPTSTPGNNEPPD